MTFVFKPLVQELLHTTPTRPRSRSRDILKNKTEKISVNFACAECDENGASMSSVGWMTLDTELVDLPRELGEFVIVHVLVYRLAPNHEKVFKSFSTAPHRYMDTLNWIAPVTLTGCPATAAPIGRTADGLPVGIQIMGPFWEDATTITFADLLSRELGGFVPPRGYERESRDPRSANLLIGAANPAKIIRLFRLCDARQHRGAPQARWNG